MSYWEGYEDGARAVEDEYEGLRIIEAVPVGGDYKPRRFKVLSKTHDLSGNAVVTILEVRGNQ